MPIKTYRCTPCKYEYEHFYFDNVPERMQKPVPPCPSCSSPLISEELVVMNDYNYLCWSSEGGCNTTFSLEVSGKPSETYPCPLCDKTARLKSSFAIVHGKNTKGASVDVAIGHYAETRWGKIHERKQARDKFRRETGSQGISIVEKDRQVFAKPISGELKPIIIPKK